MTGETKIDAIAPTLTAPAISVRLHPNSSVIGDKNIARMETEGAIRAKTVVPAANTTTHP